MMHMHRGYGLFGSGIFRLISFIIIIAIAYFIIKQFINNKDRSHSFNGESNAITILKERYAKGEIDEEEYKKRLRILNDNLDD